MSKEQLQNILNQAAHISFSAMADASDASGFDPDAAADYLRHWLQNYPNEWKLWHTLASYLLAGAGTDSPTPDQEKWNEALEIYERMHLQAPTVDLRLQGVIGLVMAYVSVGDDQRASEAAKELPRANCSYETFAPVFLRGAELREFLRAELLAAFLRLDTCVDILTDGVNSSLFSPHTAHLGSVEERLELAELNAAAWELLRGQEWAAIWGVRVCRALSHAADICMEAGDRNKALDYLERAAAFCRAAPGEKPGYYAIHDPETYVGSTRNILPSREARKTLLTRLEYALDIPAGTAAANPLTPLTEEPRWKALLQALRDQECSE